MFVDFFILTSASVDQWELKRGPPLYFWKSSTLFDIRLTRLFRQLKTTVKSVCIHTTHKIRFYAKQLNSTPVFCILDLGSLFTFWHVCCYYHMIFSRINSKALAGKSWHIQPKPCHVPLHIFLFPSLVLPSAL